MRLPQYSDENRDRDDSPQQSIDEARESGAPRVSVDNDLALLDLRHDRGGHEHKDQLDDLLQYRDTWAKRGMHIHARTEKGTHRYAIQEFQYDENRNKDQRAPSGQKPVPADENPLRSPPLWECFKFRCTGLCDFVHRAVSSALAE